MIAKNVEGGGSRPRYDLDSFELIQITLPRFKSIQLMTPMQSPGIELMTQVIFPRNGWNQLMTEVKNT